MLPFESHGYSAMESNEHVLAESLVWFNKYVKNAPPRSKKTTDYFSGCRCISMNVRNWSQSEGIVPCPPACM